VTRRMGREIKGSRGGGALRGVGAESLVEKDTGKRCEIGYKEITSKRRCLGEGGESVRIQGSKPVRSSAKGGPSPSGPLVKRPGKATLVTHAILGHISKSTPLVTSRARKHNRPPVLNNTATSKPPTPDSLHVTNN
jgi:hypothetical protein